MSSTKILTNKLTIFFIITFLFSWLVWLPIILLNYSTTESLEGILLFLLGGFGPTIIGLIFLIKSKTKNLKSRLLSFKRIGIKWLLISFLIYPIVFLLANGINVLIGGVFVPEATLLQEMLASPVRFVISTIVILLLGPVAEEIGWRGYALDNLQSRFSPLKSSLIIGLVWWAWHIPLFLMPSTLHGESGFISVFSFGYFFTAMAYSILFTWIVNHTNRSILVAILTHFSINFTIGTLLPFDDNVFAIVMFLLVLICIPIYCFDMRNSQKQFAD